MNEVQRSLWAHVESHYVLDDKVLLFDGSGRVGPLVGYARGS